MGLIREPVDIMPGMVESEELTVVTTVAGTPTVSLKLLLTVSLDDMKIRISQTPVVKLEYVMSLIGIVSNEHLLLKRWEPNKPR